LIFSSYFILVLQYELQYYYTYVSIIVLYV